MTRYSELFRKEQAEKERLQSKLSRQIAQLIDTRNQLQQFISENGLEGQFAEWAVAKCRSPEHSRPPLNPEAK